LVGVVARPWSFRPVTAAPPYLERQDAELD
jgi:hypothetical protein